MPPKKGKGTTFLPVQLVFYDISDNTDVVSLPFFVTKGKPTIYYFHLNSLKIISFFLMNSPMCFLLV